MESILKSIKTKKIPINPAVVISNNSYAKGLKIAKKLGYKKGDFPATENQSKKIITLPIHQDLKKNDIIRICKLVNKFVGN